MIKKINKNYAHPLIQEHMSIRECASIQEQVPLLEHA